MPPFFSSLRLHRLLLLLGSGLSVLVFIVLGNKGVLPLDLSTFLFFSFVMLLFALYRLGWTFLLFVGVLPLESVNLAPSLLGGLAIRPYQWLAFMLFLALGIRFALKRLPFRLFEWRFFDLFPLLLSGGGFLAILGAPDPGTALKQAVVVASFVGIYFLGRIFFRTLFDVRQALPFFLLSSILVLCYAIWQNVTFLAGGTSFEVMAGRPNATFSEADWLGLFVIVALGVGLSMLTFFLDVFLEKAKEKKREPLFLSHLNLTLVTTYLTLTFVVLLLAMARSAWLGALVVTEVFFLGILCSYGLKRVGLVWKKVALFSVVVAASFSLALIIVSLFHLSPFQLWNRIQSTGSGLQKVTISCTTEVAVPEKIGNTGELAALGCYHILLEDIEAEKQAGMFVTEVYRDDPNVSIRQEIYTKVWEVAKEHPFLGIGWGNAALFLGTDESGTGLNASNIFLEVWLGSGLLGLITLVIWWVCIVYATVRWYREAQDGLEWVYALFLTSVFIGMTVFNLFNSGILLGFFFLFFSLSALSLERLPKISFRKDTTV